MGVDGLCIGLGTGLSYTLAAQSYAGRDSSAFEASTGAIVPTEARTHFLRVGHASLSGSNACSMICAVRDTAFARLLNVRVNAIKGIEA